MLIIRRQLQLLLDGKSVKVLMSRARLDARAALVVIALLIFNLCAAPNAQSQSNPPVTTCGLPAEGNLQVNTTFTMTANCQLTGSLDLQLTTEITINGAGFTISGRDQNEDLFWVTDNAKLTINSATLDGTGVRRGQVLTANGTLVLNDVTMRNAYRGPFIYLTGTGTFTRVLFENNDAVVYGMTKSPSALHVRPTATATVTNAVFRGNQRGGGAITIDKDTNNTGSLTTAGCLTFSGNAPYNIQNRSATWTKNHSGECAGTIGNSHAAVESPPALLACGIPGRGNLKVSGKYTLSGDCDLGATRIGDVYWRSTTGAKIEIVGNGHTITGGSGTNYAVFRIASGSELVLTNVALDRVWVWSFGKLTGKFVSFSNVPTRAVWLDGNANLQNVSFWNNRTGSSNLASALMASSYHSDGAATIKNAIFTGNKGTHSSNPSYPINTLHDTSNSLSTASITLEGCVSWVGNTPSDKNYPTNATITDNSTGACSANLQIGPYFEEPALPATALPSREPAKTAEEIDCFQRLGGIGCISREEVGLPTLTIWDIDLRSKGHGKLTISQAQVAAAPLYGMMASSADARAAIYLIGPECITRNEHGDHPQVKSAECIGQQISRLRDQGGEPIGPERYIAVAKGPDPEEGKVHVVVFENAVNKRIIGTVDVFIGRPGALQAATSPEAALGDCMARADYHLNFRASPGGSVIRVLPQGVNLTVYALQEAWVKVDFHGRRGWLSRPHVTLTGSCA